MCNALCKLFVTYGTSYVLRHVVEVKVESRLAYKTKVNICGDMEN